MAFGLNFVILSIEFLRAGPEAGSDSQIRICSIRDRRRAKGAMNKLHPILIAGAALVLAALPMPAQHQHGGGASAGGGYAADYSAGARDFQRSIALQATESQSAQVRSWVQNTSALTQQLEDIRGSSKADKARDLSGELETLMATLLADNMDRENFLASLSGPQRSGLRKPVGRLDKANRALAKAFSDLTLSSGQNESTKLLVKGLAEARKAILIEQNEQARLASEMGVRV
jgi:hypothetical protein